jgi:hypothetical protein
LEVVARQEDIASFRAMPPQMYTPNDLLESEQFPYRDLILPGIIPLAIFAVLFLIEKSGYQPNFHAEGGAFVLILAFAIFFAIVIQVTTLWRVLPKLFDAPSYQTPANFASALFALLCVASYSYLAIREFF